VKSVVLVADHSLLNEEGVKREEFLERRSAVVVALASRLGTSLAGLVLYSEKARPAAIIDVAENDMDFVYGSNLAHGLAVGRQICSESGTDQIVLVVSTAPSAHHQPNGETFYGPPPVAESVQAAVDEAARCAACGLRIDSLVLGGFDDDAPLRLRSLATLIEQITLPTGGHLLAAASDEGMEAVLNRFVAMASLAG
jgi:uncharacterized protein with von Willebrand factor type A (vWA) domain